MSDGTKRTMKALALLAMLVIMTLTNRVAGQTSAPRPGVVPPVKKWSVPYTTWGHPDLQGIWNNGTTTPLERPADLTGREFLTDDEWDARAKEAATRAETRPSDPVADVGLAYNNEWWDRGVPLKRTSLIVDPENGRLPALTDEGKRRVAARDAARRSHGPADSWEDRPLQERCLLYHGVPPFPTGYNNNYQIVQTPDYVAVRYEMMAETRIIPLDGRTRPDIPQWIGNARGRWQGDTLVVETTKYSSKATFRFPASNETLRVIERFTRTAADTIDYRFTVDDPIMYTKAWTAVLPMHRVAGPIYEYACHEGNYGMEGVLRGHRADEQAAVKAKGSTR